MKVVKWDEGIVVRETEVEYQGSRIGGEMKVGKTGCGNQARINGSRGNWTGD